MTFDRIPYVGYELGFGKWLFEIRRLPRQLIRVRRIRPWRYEVQDSDENGYLTWYSVQMPKDEAVYFAEARQLGNGHTRRVRHVGSGEVVWEKGA